MMSGEDEGRGVFLREHRWQALSLLLLVCLIGTAIALVIQGNSSSSPSPSVRGYAAVVAAVPTNRVTGSGTATVELRGDTMIVTLNTNRLLNGSPHLAHIHGQGLGTCPTASSARLHNGHRSISTGDAIGLYGPTLTSFTVSGSTSGSVPNNIDMPRYPTSGNIRYKRTMTVTPIVAELIRAGDAVVVVHGIDYNNNHVYDFGALGVSDLDKTLPGEATAPALCGTLRPSPNSRSATRTGRDSQTTTYLASLGPDTTPVNDQQVIRFSLFCHIRQSDRLATGPRPLTKSTIPPATT
jgi:hypothetical protein